jgi:CheY-like chemotaxis protein
MGQDRATILVVDDDDEIRRTIADVLEDEGYRVDLAENGQEALALIDPSRPPLVILLDLMMPVMDGWGVLAALRADPALAGIPVVIISAFGARAPVPALDVIEVIAKPLTIERLLAAVSRCAA